MKKVLMCLAVAMAAAYVNAAAFAWSALNIYNGDNKADGEKAYLVFADQLSTTDAVDALTKGNVSTITGKAAQTTTISAGNVTTKVTAFERADAVAGNTYDAYFVVFSDDGKSYYMSGTKSGVAQATSQVNFAFGTQAGATQGKAWTAVGGVTPGPTPADMPEPTSGLLLMIGGAALALRRKRK